MKQTAIALGALCIAFVLTASVRAQGDDGGAEVGQYPVLVCDFGKIIDKCQERLDLEEAMKRKFDAEKKSLETAMADLQKRIEEIQKKKNLSDRDDQTYKALQQAIEEKGRLDARKAYLTIRLQDDTMRYVQELLRGARGISEEIMHARKAHLVIASKTGPIDIQGQDDFQDELLRRRVFAHVGAVDISEEVMKRMNEEYAKRKGGAANKGEATDEDK